MRASRGITLIELIATVAIAGILLGSAVPKLGKFIARQRLSAAANELIAALHLSRTIAVTRQRQTALCPSTDHIHCDREPDWAAGWLIFDDHNRNREHDPGEAILRAHGQIDGIRISTPRSRRRIRYLPDGSAPGTNVTFTVCSTRSSLPGTAFILSNTGRVRHSATAPSGHALNCP